MQKHLVVQVAPPTPRDTNTSKVYCAKFAVHL